MQWNAWMSILLWRKVAGRCVSHLLVSTSTFLFVCVIVTLFDGWVKSRVELVVKGLLLLLPLVCSAILVSWQWSLHLEAPVTTNQEAIALVIIILLTPSWSSMCSSSDSSTMLTSANQYLRPEYLPPVSSPVSLNTTERAIKVYHTSFVLLPHTFLSSSSFIWVRNKSPSTSTSSSFNGTGVCAETRSYLYKCQESEHCSLSACLVWALFKNNL